jgi:hypothetical protein
MPTTNTTRSFAPWVVSGQASEIESLEYADHAQTCDECRSLRSDFNGIAQLVTASDSGQAPRHAVPAGMTERFVARARAEGVPLSAYSPPAKSLWPKWKQALVIVTPETVVRWHRAGFRLYWNWLSRHRIVVGRKRISKELQDVIFRMVVENPTWGALRIHGELLNSDLISLSELFLAGRGKLRRTRNWQDAGRHFLTITVKPLQRWISSPFRRSLLMSCTVFS